MKLIPPTLTELGTSEKAVTLAVLIGLWTPVTRAMTGLDVQAMVWITIAYCVYAFGHGIQTGLQNFGKGGG